MTSQKTMHSYNCSPQCYLAIVLACFVFVIGFPVQQHTLVNNPVGAKMLTVLFLLCLAWLCICICERRLEPESYSVDVEALLEDSCDNQDQEGPLSAMRVLSGASLLTALAPDSVRHSRMDLRHW